MNEDVKPEYSRFDEMPKVTFRVQGEPFGKLNMRPTKINGHATLYNPPANVKYMYEVQKELFSVVDPLNFRDEKSCFHVEIEAFLQIPASKSAKKKREMALTSCPKKPDCDNISKAILDAITKAGNVWRDDSQVASISVRKRWAREAPYTEVTIIKEARK